MMLKSSVNRGRGGVARGKINELRGEKGRGLDLNDCVFVLHLPEAFAFKGYKIMSELNNTSMAGEIVEFCESFLVLTCVAW